MALIDIVDRDGGGSGALDGELSDRTRENDALLHYELHLDPTGASTAPSHPTTRLVRPAEVVNGSPPQFAAQPHLSC